MSDPDLQNWGGGGGLPDPEIRGTQLGFQKNIFSALWGSVWSKNEGGGGDGFPRSLPLIHHCLRVNFTCNIITHGSNTSRHKMYMWPTKWGIWSLNSRAQESIMEKFTCTLPIGNRGFLQLNRSSSDFKLGTYMYIRDGLWWLLLTWWSSIS